MYIYIVNRFYKPTNVTPGAHPLGLVNSEALHRARSVVVHVCGSEEEVPMDPQRGPMVMQLDGTTTHLQTVRGICGGGQAAKWKGSKNTDSLDHGFFQPAILSHSWVVYEGKWMVYPNFAIDGWCTFTISSHGRLFWHCVCQILSVILELRVFDNGWILKG